uniref:Uncharacterized protein n=1 Tax=Anguilla anguilla TaxID=7936 RepID=A0A0E9U5W2_ANGAN
MYPFRDLFAMLPWTWPEQFWNTAKGVPAY